MRVLILVWLWAGCHVPPLNPISDDPPPPPHPYLHSVRVGTFNVQFIPSTLNNMPSGDDVYRAERIADRILLGDYDIISLNEVFDEDARVVFLRRLAARFPYVVANLEDDAVFAEDSGLMLFSRFPFEPLPRSEHRAEGDDVEATARGRPFRDVAFIEYDASEGADDMSAKGAAYVRIRNPATDQIYNVAFTHMQASYPEDEIDGLSVAPYAFGTMLFENLGYFLWSTAAEVRRKQLDDLFRVLIDSAGGGVADEIGLVLGDLNIDGDVRDSDLGDGPSACCQPNLWEWKRGLQDPPLEFRDLWFAEQPETDPGLTNLQHWPLSMAPETGARLDYILGHLPGNDDLRPCVQHVMLAHNLRDGAPYSDFPFGPGGIKSLSDHIGLNLDLNRHAEFCSVRAARTHPHHDKLIPGEVRYPGSMQWTRIDETGTFAFAVPTPDATFTVYSGRDLSAPAGSWFEEEVVVTLPMEQLVRAKRYVLPEPPYFVQVKGRDRGWTGATSLVVHKANCTRQDDPCVLLPGQPKAWGLPDVPVSASDTMHYTVRTPSLTAGGGYLARVRVDRIEQDVLTLRVVDATTSTVIRETSTSEEDPEAPGQRRLELYVPVEGARELRVHVVRREVRPTSFRVAFEAGITYLHGTVPGAAGRPGRLLCLEETDTVGIDEIYLTVVADGTTVVNDVFVGDFDDDRQDALDDILPPIAYRDSVIVRLRDEDAGFNGGDDVMETAFGPLPFGSSTVTDVHRLACCGGEYQLDMNRSTWLPR